MRRVLCAVMAVLLLLPLCFAIAFADNPGAVSAAIAEPISGVVGEEMNQTVQLDLIGADWIYNWDDLIFQFGASLLPNGITVEKGIEKNTFVVSGIPEDVCQQTYTILIPGNVLKEAGSDPEIPILDPVTMQVEWDFHQKGTETKPAEETKPVEEIIEEDEPVVVTEEEVTEPADEPAQVQQQPTDAPKQINDAQKPVGILDIATAAPQEEVSTPAPDSSEPEQELLDIPLLGSYPQRRVSFTVDGIAARFSDGSSGTKEMMTDTSDGKIANPPKLNISGGYTFVGWMDSDNDIIDLDVYTPTRDEELVSVCTAAPVTASISTVKVEGVTHTQIKETNVIVTLANGSWSSLMGTTIDVTSWFKNLPNGLAVRKEGSGDSIYFVVYGKPTVESTDEIEIVIPKECIENSSADINVEKGSHAVYSILEAGVRVTGIKFNVSAVQFKRTGTSYKPSYTIKPSDATIKTVSFWSDNPKVATISDDGTVYSVGNGSTTVHVKTLDGNYQADLSITVSGAPMDMSLGASIVIGDHSSISYLKEDEQMAVTVYVKHPESYGVRWHASSGRIRLSDTATSLKYDDSTGMYKSTIYVDPRYNGSVSIYASIGSRKTDKLKFTVKGLSNYPVTGQNDWPLYIMVTVAVLAAGGLVFAYAKRRENNGEE